MLAFFFLEKRAAWCREESEIHASGDCVAGAGQHHVRAGGERGAGEDRLDGRRDDS
jgi:hypothetical protein